MVEAIDLTRPVYNAVNINIRKPEINKGENAADKNDNGIYNSVKVDIDNPAINAEPKKLYDYPENDEIVTYDKTYNQQLALPEGFPVVTQYEASTIIVPEETVEEPEAESEKIDIPEPNYTTLEDEKAEKKTLIDENNEKNITFNGINDNVKKPVIIPSEDIKPDVDINAIVDTLNSDDSDKQALQMNEIVKLVNEPEKAKEYLVSDVFSALISIAEKDVSNLEGPTKEQIEARNKIMTNFITMQQQQNNPNAKMPFEISKEEMELAVKLSPMELAERNKEYALITMAMLDKIYIDDIEKQNGNVVAMTDIPGISTMVDALRYSQNETIKIAAIDSLRYIARPEYKDELSTIFNLAKADVNPAVSDVAAYSLNIINEKQ